MKKIISALSVVALMAPSVSMAASAPSAASALSVKSASVQPVRAAAKAGKPKAAATPVLILSLMAALTGFVVASSGSDSK